MLLYHPLKQLVPWFSSLDQHCYSVSGLQLVLGNVAVCWQVNYLSITFLQSQLSLLPSMGQ